MSKRKSDFRYDSDYKMLSFLTEVYYRSKDNLTKCSDVFKGNSKKYPSSLAHQFGISKIYTATPLIQVDFLEPYTDERKNQYVKWKGKRPTFEHVDTLKEWNKQYAQVSKERVKKRNESVDEVETEPINDTFLDDRSFNLNKLIDQIILMEDQIKELEKEKSNLISDLKELINQKEYA